MKPQHQVIHARVAQLEAIAKIFAGYAPMKLPVTPDPVCMLGPDQRTLADLKRIMDTEFGALHGELVAAGVKQ